LLAAGESWGWRFIVLAAGDGWGWRFIPAEIWVCKCDLKYIYWKFLGFVRDQTE
jgi:hypothetical protein